MTIWPFGVLVLVSIGGATQAGSASDDARCIDFPTAIASAAQFAPGAAVATARRDESEAELALARSLYRPQVSTFVRSGIGDAQISDQQINNQAGVRVSQRLYDFGDARYGREAARAAIEAREFDVAATRQAAAQQVGNDYLGWIETRARLAATDQREAFFAQQNAAVASVFAQGGATLADRADIEAELAEARTAKLELALILRRFATRIALGTRSEMPPCPAARAALPREDAVTDAPDAMVREGLAKSPRLNGRRSTARNLAAQADRQASTRFPVIAATGISSFASNDFETLGRLRNRIGIDVSVPIYTGRAQNAREAAAAARKREAEGEIADLEREVEEEIRIAASRVDIRRQQLVQRRKAADFKKAQLDAAERQFAARMLILPDVIRVRIELEAAELASIETEFDLLREQLRLLVLTGRIEGAARGISP